MAVWGGGANRGLCVSRSVRGCEGCRRNALGGRLPRAVVVMSAVAPVSSGTVHRRRCMWVVDGPGRGGHVAL